MPGSTSVVSPELQAEIKAMGERIAELEATIEAMRKEAHDCGFMFAYHDPGKPTLAIRPGCGEMVRKIYFD